MNRFVHQQTSSIVVGRFPRASRPLVPRTLTLGRITGCILGMGKFDWHCDEITRQTPVSSNYRNTQNVRRFLVAECGAAFKFDRPFMAWIKDGAPKTMGDVADEWLRRQNSR